MIKDAPPPSEVGQALNASKENPNKTKELEGLIQEKRKKPLPGPTPPLTGTSKIIQQNLKEVFPIDIVKAILSNIILETKEGFVAGRNIPEVSELHGIDIKKLIDIFLEKGVLDDGGYILDCGAGRGQLAIEIIEQFPELKNQIYSIAREVPYGLDELIINCLGEEKIKEFYTQIDLPNEEIDLPNEEKEGFDEFIKYIALCFCNRIYHDPECKKKHEMLIRNDQNNILDLLNDQSVIESIIGAMDQDDIETAYRMRTNIDLKNTAARKFFDFCNKHPDEINNFIIPALKERQLSLSDDEQRKNIYNIDLDRHILGDMFQAIHQLPRNSIALSINTRSSVYMVEHNPRRWINYISMVTERLKVEGMHIDDLTRSLYAVAEKTKNNINASRHATYLRRYDKNLLFLYTYGAPEKADFELYGYPSDKKILKNVVVYKFAPDDKINEITDADREKAFEDFKKTHEATLLNFNEIDEHPGDTKCEWIPIKYDEKEEEEYNHKISPKTSDGSEIYENFDYIVTVPNLLGIEKNINKLRLTLQQIEEKIINNLNILDSTDDESLDISHGKSLGKLDEYISKLGIDKLNEKLKPLSLLGEEKKALSFAYFIRYGLANGGDTFDSDAVDNDSLESKKLWETFCKIKIDPDTCKNIITFDDLPKKINPMEKCYKKIPFNTIRQLFHGHYYERHRDAEDKTSILLNNNLDENQKEELIKIFSNPEFKFYFYPDELLFCNLFEDENNNTQSTEKSKNDRNAALKKSQSKEVQNDIQEKILNQLPKAQEKIKMPPIGLMTFCNNSRSLVPLEQVFQSILGQEGFEQFAKESFYNLDRDFFSKKENKEKFKTALNPYLEKGGMLMLSGIFTQDKVDDIEPFFVKEVFPLIHQAIEGGVPLYVSCEGYIYQMLCEFYAKKYAFPYELKKDGHAQCGPFSTQFEESKEVNEIFPLLHLTPEDKTRAFVHYQFQQSIFQENDHLKVFAKNTLNQPAGVISNDQNAKGHIIGYPYYASMRHKTLVSTEDNIPERKKPFVFPTLSHLLEYDMDYLNTNYREPHLLFENLHGNIDTTNAEIPHYSSLILHFLNKIINHNQEEKIALAA